MDNKEAIKYLIPPVATSTEPSAEYLKQKEAYELAIKALEEKPKGEWIIKPKENSQSALLICNKCKHFIPITVDKNFCPNCGADMRGKERPHNKWQPLFLKTLNGDDIVAYESSCCKAVADKKYQHCPKCLAKMKV